MVAGWAVILAALIYLSGLFAVAHFGDHYAPGAGSGRFRTTIYALTLAVYCTSWTFFGSVGLASSTGYDFLAIYVGPILVIAFGNGLVRRVIDLAKAQNILSVADFVSARYGKNARVAALVALIAVIGTIPYIALQLKAISTSLKTILDAAPDMAGPEAAPASSTLALIVTLVLAGFTTIFGTRHIDAREHHAGLTLAVATESIVKLLSFVVAGIFVVWGLFGGIDGMLHALAARSEIVPLAARSAGPAQIIAMGLLSSSIILILPRQFHMTVVENQKTNDARRAAWLFPAYLILINLFVIPIALGADLVFKPGAIDRDMAVLALPLNAGNGLVALIVFLGGLSASTAMVIVECMALGMMIANDLVMPLLLQNRAAFARDKSGDLGHRLLAIRRLAIIVVLFLGYVYFRVANDAALASIGLISFAAIAQIAPSFFGGLFWRNGTALGASAGLIAGSAIWAYTLALPALVGPMSSDGPFGLVALNPTNLFGLDLPFIANGTFFSLAANVLAYVGFSWLRAPSSIERLQADNFVTKTPARGPLSFRLWRSSVTIGDLKRVVGRYLGGDQANRAFSGHLVSRNWQASDDKSADADMLRFAEHQLASAIGAASSRRVLSLLLSGSNVSQTEALTLLDDASAALQYSRDLLQHALDHARQGITVFDRELRLTCWNREFQTLFDLPDHLMRAGTRLDEILTHNASKGLYGPGRRDRLVAARLKSLTSDLNPSRLKLFPDGRTLELRSAPLPDGGIVTTYTDITETVTAEEALARANESLEARVRERTEELLRLNSELSRAKAEAEDANLSKTRFLAAASHDILQPLNAARLYTTALVERDRKQGDVNLADNVATSLEAVEDIITTLLDISRLDAGAMKPELSVFSLDELLQQLRVELAPLAQERGITLTFVKTSAFIRSDRRLLRRLIQNLISNAIKYTQEGRVLVGCRRARGKLRLEVHDTGLGIPMSQQKAIFKEFKRLDDGAKVARGLGLGLSIVERIARLLRHPLKLNSSPGKGSMFAVELTLSEAIKRHDGPVAAQPTLTAPLAGLKVLAIDNEPAILDGMRILLEGWGCTVLLAPSVAEAGLAAIAPDIIIADYHLDDGTGLDAIRALRQMYDRPFAALLLTADRTPQMREEADAAGVTVMHKPLKPAGLRALLAQWRAAGLTDQRSGEATHQST